MSTSPPHSAVRLDALLEGLAPAPPLEVRGLGLDGRELREGEAFVALRGLRAHGLEFVQQALERGARAVIFDPAEAGAPVLPAGVVAVAVPGLRARLGEIADRCYGSPSARLSIAGITGTNGKTTCAWLLAAAASRLGARCAYAGTLGAGFPPSLSPTTHTTPDVLSVHRLLAQLAADGAARVALEASSHALDQQRLAGVRLEIAAFTNLTRDHLDYHGTLEAYAAAKHRLFELPGLSQAVVNVGDPVGADFAATLPPGVGLVRVSVGDAARKPAGRFVAVTSVRTESSGLRLALQGDFGERELRSPLVGAFNAENLVVVLGVLLAWGHEPDAAIAALSPCAAPPGRMEAFHLPGGALAIVDYAHTPDALAKVLAAARTHATGRLSVVFGCGGDRDPGKRAQMGGIAERLADRVLVTDDNPRTEDPDRIVAMILSGMREPARAEVQRDRGSAIAGALADAGAGDVVLVAGKGHEDYQLVGRERRQFSDRACVSALAGRAA
jgi:UDP-N-acetylmuramoyl-L-alanyl-D-glutamate--2,6-diaminopimelate ligase